MLNPLHLVIKPFTVGNSVTAQVHMRVACTSKRIRTCNTSRDRSLHNFFSKFGRVLCN